VRRAFLLLTAAPAALVAGAYALTPLRERLTPREFAGDECFVRAAAGEVHYTDHGPRDAPAVLLIHGFGAWTFTWRNQARALLAAGYRVVAVDQPGYGASDRPAAPLYSTWQQAAAHIAVLDALGIRRAHVVGHSFGGRVALQLAIAWPQRVAALVGICPEAFATDRPAIARIAALPLIGYALAFWSLTPALAPVGLRALSANGAPWLTPEVAAGYTAPLAVKGTTAAQVWQARSPKDGPLPVPRNLAAVRQPALLVWGARDRVFPASDGQRLLGILPDARLHIVPEAGHLPHEDAADDVSAAILAFLREQGG
jgi:pimeloyl-ACP methyl ester carboxylesterase